MKYFVAIALILAVASAAVIKPTQLTGELAEIQQIVAAINSPSTDPATAAALEAMLLDVMGFEQNPSPVAVGPAIVETSPISVGPAIVDFPMPDGGVITAEEAAIVVPSPVVSPAPIVAPTPVADSTPLVQIILNINQASAVAAESVVAPTPVVTPVFEEPIVPGPVNIVDQPDVYPSVDPIQVVNPIVQEPVVPGPVNIVEGPDAPTVEPIQVVNPIVVEPVIIGTPILPAPAVVLPEELN